MYHLYSASIVEKNKYSIGFLVNLTLECCHNPMLSNFYKFYADYEYFDKKNFIYVLYKFLLSKYCIISLIIVFSTHQIFIV